MTQSLELNRVLCDWLTLTSFDHADFHDKVASWSIDEGRNYENTRRQKRMQYAGDVCELGNGSIFYGKGYQHGLDHTMLQVSGEVADSAMMAFYDLHKLNRCKVTRIDLQITIPVPESWSQVRFFNRMKRAGRVVGWAESSTRDGVKLETVYVGSRNGERMARLYNKVTDAGVKLIRFEGEYKGERARAIYNSLNEATPARILLSHVQYLRDTKLESLLANVLNGITPHDVKVRANTENKTNEWLIKQVLPTFERVVNSHDGGDVAYQFLMTLKHAGKL